MTEQELEITRLKDLHDKLGPQNKTVGHIGPKKLNVAEQPAEEIKRSDRHDDTTVRSLAFKSPVIIVDPNGKQVTEK